MGLAVLNGLEWLSRELQTRTTSAGLVRDTLCCTFGLRRTFDLGSVAVNGV